MNIKRYVKAIGNTRFCLELVQLTSGLYCLRTEIGLKRICSDSIPTLEQGLDRFDGALKALKELSYATW
jgi:hypothetical protein